MKSEIKREPFMPPVGTPEDENAGGHRSVATAVARPRPRKFLVEYKNEHDDEEDFQRRTKEPAPSQLADRQLSPAT